MSAARSHPSVFMFLIAPFGAISGYLQVSLAYVWKQHGASVEQIAALVALSYVPHTWKFFWAPVADVTLTRRSWYVIGSLLTAGGILAMGTIPASATTLPLLSAIVVVANVAVTFLGMSVESLMAYGSPAEEHGRAGGWFQAGNLGGQGLGGGGALWVAQHVAAPWASGAALGVACLLCTIGLRFIPEPPPAHRAGGLGKSFVAVARDLWDVARGRLGFLAMVLCFLPIGSGAASGLWAAVANDWRASADTVALVTGVFGGLMMAAGCLLGGWISDRMDRKGAYLLYGILQASCVVAMALAPRTPATYIAFTMVYAVITGLTYAGFTAFVLEAMGLGAAATKYNVYASLSNFPIQYVTILDGWAYKARGPAGMLFAEATAGMIGLVLFLGVLALAARRRPAAAGA